MLIFFLSSVQRSDGDTCLCGLIPGLNDGCNKNPATAGKSSGMTLSKFTVFEFALIICSVYINA